MINMLVYTGSVRNWGIYQQVEALKSFSPNGAYMCKIPTWTEAARIKGRDGGKAAKDNLTRFHG